MRDVMTTQQMVDEGVISDPKKKRYAKKTQPTAEQVNSQKLFEDWCTKHQRARGMVILPATITSITLFGGEKISKVAGEQGIHIFRMHRTDVWRRYNPSKKKAQA